MSWLLLACVAKRVDALEAQVASLEARAEERDVEVEALQARIDALEGAGRARHACAELDLAALAASAPSEAVTVSTEDRQALRGAGGDALVTQMRVRPHVALDHGHVDGTQLAAIRADSLPSRTGFHNGDVVQGVLVGEAWRRTCEPADYVALRGQIVEGAELDVVLRRAEELLVLELSFE